MPATEKTEQVGNHGADDQVVISNDQFECPTGMMIVVVRDAKAALKWYEQALNAEVMFRYDDKEGRVMHASLKSKMGLVFGVEDYNSKMHAVAPVKEGEEASGEEGAGTKGSTYVYVKIQKGMGSADEYVERMREAGGTVVREVKDLFYGSRVGQVVDCFGVAWAFSHDIEGKSAENDASDKTQEGKKE